MLKFSLELLLKWRVVNFIGVLNPIQHQISALFSNESNSALFSALFSNESNSPALSGLQRVGGTT
ncbi:hypothetical protein BDR06DRAFT_180568 [Suillus hirtellus]|nr:hypothetical protein BDR06DRAFT_180568 [Suillus hirtellus]